MESFEELGLPEFLGRSLKRMNFVKPTPVQAQSIPAALEGRDVIASAQTGTGKTAAFGLPLLVYLEGHRDRTALVLTPTRELAGQVLEVLRQLSGDHPLGGSVLLIGGVGMGNQLSGLQGKPRLVIGTPGRVIDHLNRGSLSLASTGFLVLDEADRMLDMGFAPQLEQIRKRLTGERQTLLFSATFPPDIEAMGARFLKSGPVRIAVGDSGKPVSKISQQILYTTEPKKPEELLGELGDRRGSVLIFARTQHRVDRILSRLKDQGVKAGRIHGGRSQAQRRQAIEQFREGSYPVLVATDIAARGLDIQHIAHVINYDLPRNPEDYIHRVGRTARAGAEGESLCFITPDDKQLWGRIVRLMGPEGSQIPVKPSRFGFTGPRPEEGPAPDAARDESPRQNQGAGKPPQEASGQERPEHRHGNARPPVSQQHRSRPQGQGRPGHPGRHPQGDNRHSRQGHGQGRPQGGHDSRERRFQEGSRRQQGEGQQRRFDRPYRQDRGPDGGKFIFHGRDDRQPGQYDRADNQGQRPSGRHDRDRGEWKHKKENFFQKLTRTFSGISGSMGGDRKFQRQGGQGHRREEDRFGRRDGSFRRFDDGNRNGGNRNGGSRNSGNRDGSRRFQGRQDGGSFNGGNRHQDPRRDSGNRPDHRSHNRPRSGDGHPRRSSHNDQGNSRPDDFNRR